MKSTDNPGLPQKANQSDGPAARQEQASPLAKSEKAGFATIRDQLDAAKTLALKLIETSELLHAAAGAVLDGESGLLESMLSSMKELLGSVRQTFTPEVLDAHRIAAHTFEFQWQDINAPSAHQVTTKYAKRLFDVADTTPDLCDAEDEWEIENEIATAVFDEAATLLQIQKLRSAIVTEHAKAVHVSTAPPFRNEGESQAVAERAVDVIVSHGNRRYSIACGEPVFVTYSEDDVLTTFLEAGGSLDLAGMKNQSGRPKARETLRKLAIRYDARFLPAIKFPGKKGAGGYGVKICRDE